jgi:hypothetical protein
MQLRRSFVKLGTGIDILISIRALELSKRLGISQLAASLAAKRSEKVVKEKELMIMG